MALNKTKSLVLISPDWPAPDNVKAFASTRKGGYSHGPYAGLNLGQHVGDEADKVVSNRRLLPNYQQAVWLQQVHSARAIYISHSSVPRQADAAFTDSAGCMCTVMTADCLPVLLCDKLGQHVAAVHAGWRGLAAGIIENTVQQMPLLPANLMAWLGPAIGPQKFEVGADVRQAFAAHSTAFQQVSASKYLLDIYAVARAKLQQLGIVDIYGGQYCTYSQDALFFSHRRACHQGLKSTGRMASCIYFE